MPPPRNHLNRATRKRNASPHRTAALAECHADAAARVTMEATACGWRTVAVRDAPVYARGQQGGHFALLEWPCCVDAKRAAFEGPCDTRRVVDIHFHKLQVRGLHAATVPSAAAQGD